MTNQTKNHLRDSWEWIKDVGLLNKPAIYSVQFTRPDGSEGELYPLFLPSSVNREVRNMKAKGYDCSVRFIHLDCMKVQSFDPLLDRNGVPVRMGITHRIEDNN